MGDAFRRSSPCDLPPLTPASPRPCRRRIQKSPPFRDSKRIRSSVPLHLVGSADCHRVFPKSFYVGLGMVQYILLRKHLGAIPSIFFIPDNTVSEWNRPRLGHLQIPTIFQMRRPAQPVPFTPFGDRRLPLLPLPSNGNRNSQPAPWLTPFQFSEEFCLHGGRRPRSRYPRGQSPKVVAL